MAQSRARPLCSVWSRWRPVAVALITGLVSMREGRIRAGFRLWDTTQQLQIAGHMYRAALTDTPQLAGAIADDIIAQLVRPAAAASLCKLL